MSISAYTVALFATALFCVFVVARALRLCHKPGGLYLGLLVVSVGFWAFALGMESMVTSLTAKIFWSKLEYFSVTSSPVLLLLFALAFTQQKAWLRPQRVVLYWIVPLIVLALVLTNDWHHLVWPSFTPVPGTNILIYGHGVGFWIMVGYAYVILLVSSYFIGRNILRLSHIYRSQAIIIGLGLLPPWFANLVYVLELSPVPGWDFTPAAFALSGLFLTWGFTRLQLLDLVPVAREVLIDRMSDGLLVLDMEDRVVDINPAALKILDSPKDNPIGRPIQQVWSPLPLQLKQLHDGATSPIAVMWRHAAVEHHYDLRISPLTDGRGLLTGRLVVIRDVTEREALIEDLDAFAHSVAHDLKAPFNVILGYADLLEELLGEMGEEEMVNFAATISRTAVKSARIVDELLLLANVRQRDDVKLHPLDTGAILWEVQMRLAPFIAQAEAEVAVPAAWPTALGYAPWVEEVWFNYLSNALKYGGKPPHVEVGADTLRDGRVRFWVRDNGEGLDAESQAALFKPFSRMSDVTVEGHGLGLSIVRRIVEKLGGEVGVESAPGAGSTFYFILPGAPVAKGPLGHGETGPIFSQ